jgi:hypothetical protein
MMLAELGERVDSWPPGLNISISQKSERTVKRASGKGAKEVVAVCARHNLRANNAGHRHRSKVDPARSSFNSILAGKGCPEDVANEAAELLENFGVQLRRVDAVVAFELVIQPPDACDSVEWWCKAMQWVYAKYEHVLSAVVHRDQARVHAHVLVLAVQGGRHAGRDMQRGRWAFRTLRVSFGHHMGAPAQEPKDGPITRLALTAGKGPKTHEEAARRDAGLMRNREDIASGHQPNVLTRGNPMSIVAQPPVGPWWSERCGEFGWLLGL